MEALLALGKMAFFVHYFKTFFLFYDKSISMVFCLKEHTWPMSILDLHITQISMTKPKW